MLLGPFHLRSAGCPSAADAVGPYSPLVLVRVLLVAALYSFWLLRIYVATTTVSSSGWFAVRMRARSYTFSCQHKDRQGAKKKGEGGEEREKEE